MTEFSIAVDQLRIAMARANRVIMQLGGKPLPYPTWMRR